MTWTIRTRAGIVQRFTTPSEAIAGLKRKVTAHHIFFLGRAYLVNNETGAVFVRRNTGRSFAAWVESEGGERPQQAHRRKGELI